MQEQVLQKVKQYIAETEMIKQGCTVIAGVSGGPDSMVMLDILRRIQKEYNFFLRVVHVNHGIRGKEALRDQKTVQKICREWKIPCCVYSYDVPCLSAEWKMGTEEAGRKVRRAAFEEEKKKCTSSDDDIRIALAHNKNDVAETMLHHLARGSGIRGMAALKPVNGEFIRPVICLERDEIVDYIKETGIPSVMDSSNFEDDYTRNRIRHHILPLMTQEINAKAVSHMAEASELFRQAEEYFKTKAEEMADNCAGKDGTYLLDKEFFTKETILQNYAVREILERLSGHRNDLTAGHIRQVQKLYENQSGRKISLPYGVEALRCYGGVKLQKKTEEILERTEEAQVLNMEGDTIWENETFRTCIFPYSGEKILEKKYTKWLDCDKINCELSVRTRRSGDYMTVNQSGGRKKLTRCMIDDKIPGEIRQEIPLVAAKDEILWIVGGRISERYKITSQTEKVLEITYQGGSIE